MPNRCASAALLLFLASGTQAKVTRFVIEQRETPAFRGQAFGAAGVFERLSGRFYGELDPRDPNNAIITDIQFAPRNARGMVEYSGTFALAKPVDMTKASGVLYYQVPNRGGGNPVGWDEGHVSVVSGWQGDIPATSNLQSLTVPVARNRDGSPLTGPVLLRLIDMPANSTTAELAQTQYAGLTYQRPVTLDTAKASLTRRSSATATPAAVAASDWAFADCTKAPFPGTPDPTRICLKTGFEPASEYVLVFTAKDPLVLGIGYAATRDLNSFLRYAEKDEQGTANPVAGKIRWSVSRGDSQSGNFIRSFVHLGFNRDEAGRIVWDGILPHIAARQLALNFRFAIAGGNSRAYDMGSEAVLWWGKYTDRTRQRPAASLLDRCNQSNTCPKVVETFGGVEFWYLWESVGLVGTDAKADIPLPANVRRYFFPGTTHGGGAGGFRSESAVARGCVLPGNPNPESDTLRALSAALVDWVAKGTEPPPSRYPRLDRGELVPATQAALTFPSIPGVPAPDRLVNAVLDRDYGPQFQSSDLSGVITRQPPIVKQEIPMRVPKVDADGTDVGGVPSVLRQVPLGTYLGWNVTAAGFDRGKVCGLSGGYVPFAKTKAERLAANDPRPSLEERYGSHAAYVEKVKAAAEQAVKDRVLLRRDANRLVAEAEASSILR